MTDNFTKDQLLEIGRAFGITLMEARSQSEAELEYRRALKRIACVRLKHFNHFTSDLDRIVYFRDSCIEMIEIATEALEGIKKDD